MTRIRLAIASGLLLGSALLLAPAPSSAEDACLECHGQSGQSATFKNGDRRDVTIDPKAWAASVHGSGGLACTDCHSDLSSYPHPDLAERSSRDLTLRLYTSCQQCHEEQYKKTLDSVHQRALAAGNKKAAVCADCHDPHTQRKITGAEGKLLPEGRVGIPKTCSQCHGEIYSRYRASVHGSALVDGNPDVPTCIDCHGVHNIPDPTHRALPPRLAADVRGLPHRQEADEEVRDLDRRCCAPTWPTSTAPR